MYFSLGNDGFGANSGPSRDDPRGSASRPEETNGKRPRQGLRVGRSDTKDERTGPSFISGWSIADRDSRAAGGIQFRLAETQPFQCRLPTRKSTKAETRGARWLSAHSGPQHQPPLIAVKM